MQKIKTGSIVKNLTDLQQGSAVDQIKDRHTFMRSDDPVYWDNGQLLIQSPLLYYFQADDGTYSINRINNASDAIQTTAGYIPLANGDCIIIQLSRVAGTTTLTAGTYGTLAAGQYCVVNASSLGSINLERKDQIVLFRRQDSGSTGEQQLMIPISKQMMRQGGVAYLGQIGINANAGAYVTARMHDPVATTLPTGTSYTVDGLAVANGHTVLFSNLSSGNNRVFVVTGVGTSLVWTPISCFNGFQYPVDGDTCRIRRGNAFADQLGVFTGTAWKFNDYVRYFNGTDYWELSSLQTATLYNNSTGNIFTVTALGTENVVVNYSITRGSTKETGTCWITHDGLTAQTAAGGVNMGSNGITFNADISGGLLRFRYTADNSGTDATIKYSTSRWSDNPGGPGGLPSWSSFNSYAGGYLYGSFCMSDGSGIEVNCSAPYNVSGKTRIDLTSWTYLVGLHSGTTLGNLEVLVNGQTIPRYLVGVTLDAYYKEIDNDTIEFHTDVMAASPAVSIEIRKRQGTVDTGNQTAARQAALYPAIVGSSAQLAAGQCTHTTIAQAITDVAAGDKILLLKGTYTENVTLTKELFFEGLGRASVINGTVTLDANSDHSLIKYVKIVGNLTFNAGADNCNVSDCWMPSGATITNNGTGNLYSILDD